MKDTKLSKEMVFGIKIEFNKEYKEYFENEWNNDIDTNYLLISLLETINDICVEHNLDSKEIFKKAIIYGSVDNYTSNEEKELMKNLKTYEGE